ncbi:MAG: glycine betaine ABC transporter substrate-binding protein [Ilumatobacteraceae bacterium]
MINLSTTRRVFLAGAALALGLAACGDDTETATTEPAGAETTAAAGDECATSGDAIKIAVNPWSGSIANANVAKIVIECELGTPVELVELDENATWVGLDDGSLDVTLEVWPSGHAADYETYVTGKGSVVDLGLLGPEAKIGWYVPKFIVDEHPELATWEGFQDPALAGLFATAETGELGQFLMGDPSYVTYDEQIIANLELPLKYVVAGSEAALLTAIDQSIADQKPVLMQLWKPHWKQSRVELVEVKLPDVTDACLASAAAGDGMYACDYPVDLLYKAANAGLEAKNAAVFGMLSKMQLTTDQQASIAALMDGDGMAADAAAQQWISENEAVWSAWIG